MESSYLRLENNCEFHVVNSDIIPSVTSIPNFNLSVRALHYITLDQKISTLFVNNLQIYSAVALTYIMSKRSLNQFYGTLFLYESGVIEYPVMYLSSDKF